MTNNSSVQTNFSLNEVPTFAPVDTAIDCEGYLYCTANLPHAFISLTTEDKDLHHQDEGHHPATATTTTTKSILKPITTNPTSTKAVKVVDFAFTTRPQPPSMERKHSEASSTISSVAQDEECAIIDDDEGYLGGGALRHVEAYSHLSHVAAEHTVNPPVQQQPQKKGNTVVERKVHADNQGWMHVMDWWPEPMEGMTHQWVDEFYE